MRKEGVNINLILEFSMNIFSPSMGFNSSQELFISVITELIECVAIFTVSYLAIPYNLLFVVSFSIYVKLSLLILTVCDKNDEVEKEEVEFMGINDILVGYTNDEIRSIAISANNQIIGGYIFLG